MEYRRIKINLWHFKTKDFFLRQTSIYLYPLNLDDFLYLCGGNILLDTSSGVGVFLLVRYSQLGRRG